MNAFAAWGLALLGLAVITSLSEMFLPQGRMQRTVRNVTAALAALLLVAPLPSLFDNKFEFGFGNDAGVGLDENYLDYNKNLIVEQVNAAASDYLASKGYDGIAVAVTMDGFSVKSVAVKFDNSVMTGENRHINKQEIIKSVAEYFGIDEEAIMAYG